jgi:glycosyltransferase involved in cell wall biosynthesis
VHKATLQNTGKLKICYISNPNSIHTQRWLSWFSKRGHDVSLIADAAYHDDISGVRVYDLTRLINTRVLRFAVWALITHQLVHRWQPDILHAHRVSSAGWLGAFSGFHPFVVTSWGSDLLYHPDRSRVASRLVNYVLIRADRITTDSHALRRRAIEFGAEPDLTEVIQFGVDSSKFHPGMETIQLRQQLDTGSSQIVLSSRAIAPIYNIDVIIQSIPVVLSMHPDTIFIFKKYNVDPDYKARLDAQIIELGISNHVRWVGPAENEQEIARLYCLSDVVVSIPSSDSTPSSLLEAMACARPVIVSDLPSLHEWITEGKNGYFVPVRDPDSLADALCTTLKDSTNLTAIGSNNRSAIMERADYHTEMQKVETIYYELTESS